MTECQRRKQLEKILKNCPDLLTPIKAVKYLPIGRNKLYEALKNNEMESYVYKGGYIFTKDAVIDYLIKTTDDIKHRKFVIKGDRK